MLRSLHFRFIVANVLVVIVSVALTALIASRVTGNEFQRFMDQGDVLRGRRLVTILSDVYGQSGSWADVQPAVERMSQTNGERVAVADSSGTIVGDSGHDLIGQTVPSDRLPHLGKMFFDGVHVGYLLVNPASAFAPTAGSPQYAPAPPRNSASVPSPPDRGGFLNAMNRYVLLSALVAGVIAILVTLILWRRVLQPVADLTAAAHKMEKGDLSVRVKVEGKDEVGQLGQAFNAMADGLSRLEQLRRNMVNDVAHELRTPLTNLRGYLEAARDEMVSPDSKWIDSLYEETMLLNRLTNDLQDLALAEARQLRLVRLPVNLGGLAQSALDAVRRQAEARGLRLGLAVVPDLPPADADPERIGQVLRNLLNNALEFTPRGGEVTVTVGLGSPGLRVDVHDTGPGIAPEHLPLVFERFYRVDPSRSRATGGAGIGLTIVKNLVEAHGGRVWADSTPGAGSTFGFSLPVAGAGERLEECVRSAG